MLLPRELELHGYFTRALVDTGAARTVLRRREYLDICERIGRQPILRTARGLLGVTGHKLKVWGTTQLAEDSVGTMTMVVVDQIPHAAKLGRDLMSRDEAKIDYKRGILCWRDKQFTLRPAPRECKREGAMDVLREERMLAAELAKESHCVQCYRATYW